MKKDIENREDIVSFFNLFYDQLLKDDLFIPFFSKIVEEGTLEQHIQTMSNFWDNILFFTGKYEGNPMEKHTVINLINSLEPIHFTKWVSYFINTIDQLYSGEKANLAKDRVVSIAALMQKKIL